MEDMGTIILDGKMYNLNTLTVKELKVLEKKLKEKEEECDKKIDEILNNK